MPADCGVLPVNQLAGVDGAAVCCDTFSVLHPRCHRAVELAEGLIAVSLSISLTSLDLSGPQNENISTPPPHGDHL